VISDAELVSVTAQQHIVSIARGVSGQETGEKQSVQLRDFELQTPRSSHSDI
jgi:hypothetical protein